MRAEHGFMNIGTDPETSLYVYGWLPDGDGTPAKAVVQIAHGMAETAARYERFAAALTARGYAVFAGDHRGHGRTAGRPEAVGDPGPYSFARMTDDLAAVTERIAARHPGAPIVLFGHSMGSFLAQQYMYRHPGKLAGVILSGSDGPKGPELGLGLLLARLEARWRGDGHRSRLLNALTFGGYNRRFRPVRTAFDWLSRDPEEVDRYIADPYCGGVFTAGFFRDFFAGLRDIHKPEHLRRIPRELPILIVSGDKDPVGRFGAGVRQLADLYRQLGFSRVRCKLYPGGRHELLNETNREEVTDDVLQWLDRLVEEAPDR